MQTLTFILPLFNDWKSLQKLLLGIDKQLETMKKKGDVLIVDDNSYIKPDLNFLIYKKIKKIKILKLKMNLGSQKAISIGLSYLKSKKIKTIITILDSDGEDDYTKIPEMVNKAYEYPKKIIVSCRTKRKEGLIFNFFYLTHKIILFIFSGKWIDYGNFSSFNSNNLDKILSNNNSWFALSSCMAQNCLIYKMFAERKKRFFGKSKLSFPDLIFHAMRVNVVFKLKIFIMSLLYSYLSFYFIENFIILSFFLSFIVMFNIMLMITYILVKPKNFLVRMKLINKTKLV